MTARDIVSHHIAQFDTNYFGDAFFDRQFRFMSTGIPPASLHHFVIRCQLIAPSQVEFAPDVPFRVQIVGIILRRNILAVDFGQPPPDHRIHARLLYFVLLKKILQRLYLIRLDIDQKMIRCVRRQTGMPIVDQIILDQREHQHRHQAQPQRHRLQNTRNRTAADAGETVAPRPTGLMPQTGQQADQQPAQTTENDDGSDKATNDVQP